MQRGIAGFSCAKNEDELHGSHLGLPNFPARTVEYGISRRTKFIIDEDLLGQSCGILDSTSNSLGGDVSFTAPRSRFPPPGKSTHKTGERCPARSHNKLHRKNDKEVKTLN